MSEAITPAISDRICKHMNDDHSDAVLVYAQVYGKATEAISAKMETIDPEGMNLSVINDSGQSQIRINFPQPLTSAKEAHHVLVDMLKQAREN
jgi:putative heme iron utilization protein